MSNENQTCLVRIKTCQVKHVGSELVNSTRLNEWAMNKIIDTLVYSCIYKKIYKKI